MVHDPTPKRDDSDMSGSASFFRFVVFIMDSSPAIPLEARNRFRNNNVAAFKLRKHDGEIDDEKDAIA
jgi:hypothetical protein